MLAKNQTAYCDNGTEYSLNLHPYGVHCIEIKN